MERKSGTGFGIPGAGAQKQLPTHAEVGHPQACSPTRVSSPCMVRLVQSDWLVGSSPRTDMSSSPYKGIATVRWKRTTWLSSAVQVSACA